MKRGYLLNNTVYFVPEMNQLIAKHDPSLTVLLNTPVSRCLLLLIENPHDIISQKVFLQKVWENNGSSVSANSLHQSISLLRKALKSVGLHEVIITTVPRKGITLHASVQISVIGNLETEWSERDPAIPPPDIPPQEINFSHTSTERITHPLLRWKVLGIMVFLAVIIVTCFIWVNKTMVPDRNSFKNYTASIRKGNCEFFFKPGPNALSEYTRFIESHEFTCTRNRKIFLTINVNKGGASVVKCDAAADSYTPEQCDTPYYLGDNKAK